MCLRYFFNSSFNLSFEAKVAAAYADGSVSLFALGQNDDFEIKDSWNETRLRPTQKYVGLSVTNRLVERTFITRHPMDLC